MESFLKTGLPDRKNEEWRYSPLGRLENASFQIPPKAPELPPESLEALGFGDLDTHRLVLVNGHFSPELSRLEDLPDGVMVQPLSAALAKKHPALEKHLTGIASDDLHAFNALNTAFATEGLFVHVKPGVRVETPIQLVCLAAEAKAPWCAFLRHLIVLEAGSQATLVESYLGPDNQRYMVNAVLEGRLEANSCLRHVKDQREGQQAVHLRSARVEQSQGSRWTHFDLNLGGHMVRNDVEANLHQELAHVEFDGLATSRRQQHMESHTVIDHEAPHCTSRELYKSILDDQARGVFRGRVLVRQDAQLTDSQQQNKNLLLSAKAEIDTKPELEIYADDVKAAHGATIGQLDPEHIFFLRARGLSEEHARRLLIQAFARDLLGRIQLKPVREGLSQAFGTFLLGSEKREG
jgi:Fe-S cluster assembly protein SufD